MPLRYQNSKRQNEIVRARELVRMNRYFHTIAFDKISNRFELFPKASLPIKLADRMRGERN